MCVTHAVGLAIRTTTGCPHLRGAVVDIATGQLVSTFEHKASAGAGADQIHQLAQDLASELKALEPAAVLIREVAFARPAGLTAAVKNRVRAEGACVGIARAVTATVAVMDTKAIAHLLGVSGVSVDDAGKALTSDPWVESATAAVAAAKL
jgi:hypothetical protein